MKTSTHQLPNGTIVCQQIEPALWVATFPGFQGTGKTEVLALSNLARKIWETGDAVINIVVRSM